jgi:hypothetical protein
MKEYNTARANLLLVVVLTVISVLTTIFSEDGTYFVFSAAVPRYLVFIGCMLCGKYPNVNYEEFFGIPGFEPLNDVVLIIMVVIASIIILAYFLCWVFSSKGRKGAFIVALVLFSIDTIALPILFSLTSIILDLVLHVLVILYLVKGIVAINKLDKIALEESNQEDDFDDNQYSENL